MKANLLFMSTSAFLQTMLANRLPIPLIEVRANIMFCLPSTFVFSTRRMCWKSSFATRDCTRNHIKTQFSKHIQKDTILKLEKEKNAYFERWDGTIFFAEALSLCRWGICIVGFLRSVLSLLLWLFLTQFYSLGFSRRAGRDKRNDSFALEECMLTLILRNNKNKKIKNKLNQGFSLYNSVVILNILKNYFLTLKINFAFLNLVE